MNEQLLQKIEEGRPLNQEEGLALYDLPIHELGRLALKEKQKRFGSKITFVRNYYLNFTNICQYACKYCGFRRSKNATDAYTLSLEQIEQKLLKAPEKISEIWFSSGLNLDLPFQYYIDLVKMVKKTMPSSMIKAFTAVEIDFFAKHYKMKVEDVLDLLIEAGLDRIPGGGAEIFNEAVRAQIDIKTRPEDYLHIHKLCHERDIPTSMTMLFGHIEKKVHRIEHMLRIRDFQSKSGGVQAFIPLAFQAANNPLAKKGVKGPLAYEILQTLAISRLILNNVDHIQAFWVDVGEDLTQLSLHYGVDDINGTLIEENIAHSSGSKTATYQTSEKLKGWIEGAQLIPVERDCRFNEIIFNAK